jgi:hypothetical protein
MVPVPTSELGKVAAVAGVSILADGGAGSAIRPGSRLWDRSGPGAVELSEGPPAVVGELAAGGLSQVRVVAYSQAVAARLGAAQVFALERADGLLAGAAVDVQVNNRRMRRRSAATTRIGSGCTGYLRVR